VDGGGGGPSDSYESFYRPEFANNPWKQNQNKLNRKRRDTLAFFLFSAVLVCSFRSVPRRIRPVCKDRGFGRQMPSPRRTAKTVLATNEIQDSGLRTQDTERRPCQVEASESIYSEWTTEWMRVPSSQEAVKQIYTLGEYIFQKEYNIHLLLNKSNMLKNSRINILNYFLTCF